MGTKLSALTAVTSVNDTDEFYIVTASGPTSYKITGANMKTAMMAGVVSGLVQQYSTHAGAVTAITTLATANPSRSYLGTTPGNSTNGNAGGVVFNIGSAIISWLQNEYEITAINTTTTSLQAQITAINAAIAALNSVVGSVQIFDPNDSTTWQILPGTGYMISNSYSTGTAVPATGSVTIALPDHDNWIGGELVIFYGAMGGNFCAIDPTIYHADQINGQISSVTSFGTSDNIEARLRYLGTQPETELGIWVAATIIPVSVATVVAGTETGAVRANVSIDPTDPANPIISVSPAMEHNWTCIALATISGGYTPVDLLADNTLSARCIIRPANLFIGKKFSIETSFRVNTPGKDAFFIAIGTDIYGDFDPHEPTFDIGGNGVAPTDASGSNPYQIEDGDLFKLKILLMYVEIEESDYNFTYRAELWNVTKGVSIQTVDGGLYDIITLPQVDQIIYAKLGLENCGDSVATISVQQVDGWQESSNGLVADQEG